MPELRACLTHVAIIASRPDVQRMLPQELLGNQRVLLARDTREVQPHMPSNVRIIRGKCGWTNVAYVRGLMHRIAPAVRRVGDHLVPVLLMDCARQRIHRSVFAAAARQGVRVVLIPAKLTWLLQPRDTHVFQRYKRYFGV